MREYGSVSPQFWIGRTGKAMRGDAQTQLLALYLMTSPHANMIGVYHCPVAYMAHETGLSTEGASMALQRLIEADFCVYDEADEYVFVCSFAEHQVGESLSAADKRCKGVQNELAKVPKNQCRQAFTARYAAAYNLPADGFVRPKNEAPSKPLASQEQEQEQEQDKEEAKAYVASVPLPTVGGAPALPVCPAEKMVELYHEVLPELPRVRVMDDARRKAMQKRWRWVLTSRRADGVPRACNAAEALGWLRQFFERARDNDFLMGRSGRGAGHESWQCDLDHLMSDKGLKAVIEKTGVAA
jgi:hypothetical protein